MHEPALYTVRFQLKHFGHMSSLANVVLRGNFFFISQFFCSPQKLSLTARVFPVFEVVGSLFSGWNNSTSDDKRMFMDRHEDASNRWPHARCPNIPCFNDRLGQSTTIDLGLGIISLFSWMRSNKRKMSITLNMRLVKNIFTVMRLFFFFVIFVLQSYSHQKIEQIFLIFSLLRTSH